jgi:hypothetical protein
MDAPCGGLAAQSLTQALRPPPLPEPWIVPIPGRERVIVSTLDGIVGG